ncbi:MAG: hypothetical protein GKR89_15310 [Candidatus Latescibacteria bacterium]|nr:hypothetical protein [Candidatus Latescibacterota bacterium]
MSPTNYRVCIVGLSGIGTGKPATTEGGLGRTMPHSHAESYAFVPRTQVVGVCDLLDERVDEFVDAWAGTFPEVKGYTDFSTMLAEQQPDLLSVVTSDNRHADIVVQAAESGVRGIFCEKPIATSLADADRMIDALERHHVVCNINHTRRWYPSYRQAVTQVAAGAIGQLQRITLNFGGPRAILFRNGTHMIDTICWLAGADPEWVFAELDEGYQDYWPYQGDGGRNPDLEPGCSGFIHFANGVRAFYNGSKGTKPRSGFELTGTDGWLWVDERRGLIGTDAGVRPLDPPPLTCSDSPAAIEEIIQAIEGGPPVSSPPRQARKTLEIILGFLASQKGGNCRINFPLDEAAV